MITTLTTQAVILKQNPRVALGQVTGIYTHKQIFWGRKAQLLKFSPLSPSSSPNG